MFRKIAAGLALGSLVLVIAIATRPAAFRIERTAQVNAPAAVVFGLINDFHQWAQWSPWERIDPSLHRSFWGPPAGPGAGYGWAGNNEVGEGRMTILDSKVPEEVTIKLEFIKPFAATNTATFLMKPSAGGTRVTWAMEGTNGFIAKAFGMLMDMDKLVGKDFEQGLANLNTAAQPTN